MEYTPAGDAVISFLEWMTGDDKPNPVPEDVDVCVVSGDC
jgi:hypothetical protein